MGGDGVEAMAASPRARRQQAVTALDGMKHWPLLPALAPAFSEKLGSLLQCHCVAGEHHFTVFHTLAMLPLPSLPLTHRYPYIRSRQLPTPKCRRNLPCQTLGMTIGR